MGQTYAVRASIREGGVTYRSPDEAYAAAEVIESDAAERADAYRRNGDEGIADSTIDAGRAKAERLRAWARQREEYEAKGAEQPEGSPTAPKKAARSSQGRRSRSSGARTGKRSSGKAFGGKGGAIARRGYTRSGAQAAVRSAGGIGWQIAGLTIGVALLTLFLSRRGSQAFGELANFAAASVRIVVDPVDPLEPHALDKLFASSQPAVKPPAGARGPVGTPRATRRPPANRRARRTVAV